MPGNLRTLTRDELKAKESKASNWLIENAVLKKTNPVVYNRAKYRYSEIVKALNWRCEIELVKEGVGLQGSR